MRIYHTILGLSYREKEALAKSHTAAILIADDADAGLNGWSDDFESFYSSCITFLYPFETTGTPDQSLSVTETFVSASSETYHSYKNLLKLELD